MQLPSPFKSNIQIIPQNTARNADDKIKIQTNDTKLKDKIGRINELSSTYLS